MMNTSSSHQIATSRLIAHKIAHHNPRPTGRINPNYPPQRTGTIISYPLLKDTDCGDCSGGLHCAKCLWLDRRRSTPLQPSKSERWMNFDLVPDGRYTDDFLYHIRSLLSDLGLLTKSVDRAVHHVIANLQHSTIVHHNRRSSMVTPNGDKVSRQNINDAVDTLEAVGLLSKTKGTKGRVSTISGTAEFWITTSLYGPKWKIEPHPTIIHNRSDHSRTPPEKTSRLQSRLDKWLTEINKFNHDHPLLLMKTPKDRLIIRPTLRRVFNDGMQLGGRVYAIGGSYQGFEREDRRILWLEGQRVAEPDFSAHHIRLAYTLEGSGYSDIHGCDNDPYHIMIDGEVVDRDICKTLALVGINNISETETLRSYRKKVAAGKAPPCDGDELKDIYRSFLEKHAPIHHWFGTSKENGLRLHKIEGEIMIRAMHKLMKQGIPSYPLHDSLIVPESARQQAISAMTEAYHQTLKAMKLSDFDEPRIS